MKTDVLERIRELMNKNNMSNADLARKIFDIPENEPVPAKYRVRISDYFKGKANIPNEILKKISKIFNVDFLYLLGEEIPITYYLPLIGSASCGVPTNHFYADMGEYEMIPVPASLYREGRYFVKAEGDSMLPKIKNGDEVLCDPNMHIDNGNIVHYTLNGESGIKKIIMDETGSPIMLMPLNEKYSPIPIKKGDELRLAKCIRVMTSL